MEPLLRQDFTPEKIVLSRDRSTLALSGQDVHHALSAERLRLACRCAWCTRDRLTDSFPHAFKGMRIEDVAAIGAHGLHITFSDGHARGIFPFRYLSEIVLNENSCAEVTA